MFWSTNDLTDNIVKCPTLRLDSGCSVVPEQQREGGNQPLCTVAAIMKKSVAPK
ncbi:hypothetical protein MTR_7g111490 [Medicago truncatula]|uniref:Uncharacterized protein n=1 Tax=Medicago truncatula TaxID=3880 RepID=Q2HRR2_MEDTR|nr:hypothetical protein MtrDRAFT_AC157894g33v2 [Medicago truncatula]AES82356.1 hypothetical protein MTR_7g111490 [Medicago truncatula]